VSEGAIDETSNPPPVSDVLTIAVRAYGVPAREKAAPPKFGSRGPSKWSVIFDTETTTDEAQRVRLGAYQLREGHQGRERGLFFNPEVLSAPDRRRLKRYAAAKRLKLITLKEFVEQVIVGVGYGWQATLIGFNLPFDISRVAADHGDARGSMRPGFSFDMAPNKKGPRVRVRHLTGRAALMKFYGPGQRLPRGQKKRKVEAAPRRPALVDVSTLASALLGRAFSLSELAKHLNTPDKKLGVDEHGKALTPEYLDYAVRDVDVTWQCFVELSRRYAEHGLSRTRIERILSEAGIGKGYLREMGIRGQREMQPDFPPALIGKIMGTYFGGRTEVHLRRVVSQVLYCDFTSMYPTVSSCMGLWPFVIAKGMISRDATAEIRRFVENVTLADLQRRETWPKLHAIVEIQPDGDILPVRAKYGADKHYTIGLNHLTSDQPLWYPVADCVASKLLNGRAPRILQAIAFEPGEPQDGLRPVAIAGKPAFSVDPYTQDFFKRVVELRMQTEGAERNALKLVANATGYGIFVQLDVNERSAPIAVRCHPANGPEFLVDMDNVEEPGEFFHPVLGTLITSAARLMLAITERLVSEVGLDWVFCDTDSMALAKPLSMSDAEFVERANAVRSWFKKLNPYGVEVDLFKLEDANFRVVDGEITGQLEPLYCFPVSSKRYVLFNIDGAGQPVIRKASAHGLGHLLPPYGDAAGALDIPAPVVSLDKIGVSRWQYDFWYRIARAALSGNPDRPDLSGLPNFEQPAASRYAATTTHLLRWFDQYNQGKPDAERVRPFNFMHMYHADPLADWEGWREANGMDVSERSWEPPCVIAPYDGDAKRAVKRCFDRDTGMPVPVTMLKSYWDAFAQYHLRPEAKRLNADYLDSGSTQRRHVQASRIVYIGKEANRWEEQSYLGIDPEAQITYGTAPDDRERLLLSIRQAADIHGQRALAKAAQISLQQVSAILMGAARPTDKTLAKLAGAVAALDGARNTELARYTELRAWAKGECERVRLRTFARAIGIDAANLAKVLSGGRKLSGGTRVKLEQVFARKTSSKSAA
jgi:hypothetical protein